jgi:predicted nucleic acid-binding protein
MYEPPFGAAATTSSTNDNCRQRQRCFALVLSAERIRSGRGTLRSDDHLIAPDLVIAEITNAAWKFVTFDRMPAESAISAVREVAKAFEELVPMSVLKDRALAIAIELRHPAYDCFYLALAERSSSPLVTADERLIRRCADTPFEKLVQSL